MNKKSFVGSALLLLLAALAFWWLRDATDPAVAELQEMLQTPPEVVDSIPEEQREQGAEMFRQKVAGLTDEQRKAFFETAMPFMMGAMGRGASQFRAKLDAMTPAERAREIDNVMDNLPKMAGGQDWGFPSDPKAVDSFRKKFLDWTTPEQRSDLEALGKMFEQRRQERGLPDPGGGGFF